MMTQGEKTGTPATAARKSPIPQALILAAGKGSRLGKAADGLPKCLIQVGGRPLIRHQLDALADAGISPVLVLIGYGADLVRETVGESAESILNPRYAATNSLHSFFLAKDWIKGPALILNSDLLCDPRLLEALLRSGEDSLAYDSLSGYAREHMKVAVRDGKVTNLSKDLPEEGTSGENVGMLYLSRRTLDVVFNQAEKLVAADRTDAFLAEAIRASLGLIELKAVDVAGIPWTEIDTPHDLERARRELWPKISERCGKRTGAWRVRERRRRLLGLLAMVAALALVFSLARISGPRSWETLSLSGIRSVSPVVDGIAKHWWRVDGEEPADCEIEGPRSVALELRCVAPAKEAGGGPCMAEVLLDGARHDLHKFNTRPDPQASLPDSTVCERQKVMIDVPAGRHRIAVRHLAGDAKSLLVRFRVASPE
ncbi:MAG: phosphocholine cytidylyltransferase family protein [Planctomycetes bacterium]|nr:phosphocholine cytidylyltransferase family protein [Planctomycetota bacterium]